jgi:hypothetical protein
VTPEERKDGWYHFLSNWRSMSDAVPSACPAEEPDLTIPPDNLEPYEPEAVTVTRHTGDVEEPLYQANFPRGAEVEVYRSTEGSLYAAVAVSVTERASLPEERPRLDGRTFWKHVRLSRL